MITKKYKTKSGLNARVICSDMKVSDTKFPIIVLMEGLDGKEKLYHYTKELTFYSDRLDDYDLVEVKEKDTIDVHLIVYADGCVVADGPWFNKPVSKKLIANLYRRIEYEKGEGL